MTREEKALLHINPKGRGLEIGPSYNPIAPKKKGFNVDIIDHMSREDLINKYKEFPANIDNIEEVDFIWRGETYAELTGKHKYYDWIIASHLIEHTPDLIGFLNDCDTLLKDDGVLSLIVPDKRYCFDIYRPLTGISKLIDSHLQKNKIHTPGAVAEFFLDIVSQSGNPAWSSDITGEFDFFYSLERAQEEMNSVIQKKQYVDIHAWCFVPHSFRLLIHDLFSLGFIPFQEVSFYPTDGCEFFVTLSRCGEGIKQSRLELLQIIATEIANVPLPTGYGSHQRT